MEGEETMEWIQKVLAKAGPRLCQSPERFFALVQLLNNPHAELDKQVIRDECDRLLTGLPCFCGDIVFDIERGLGFHDDFIVENPYTVARTPFYNHPIFFEDDVWINKMMKKIQNRINDIEDQIELEKFVIKTRRQVSKMLKRWRMKIVHKCREKIKESQNKRLFSSNFKFNPSESDGFGYFVTNKNSKAETKLSTRSVAQPCPINKIDHMPRYVTNIPTKSVQLTSDQGQGSMLSFVPGVGPNAPDGLVKRLLTEAVEFQVNAAVFPNCDEEELQIVSYLTVQRFGPDSRVVTFLANSFQTTLAIVRTACVEFASSLAPTHSNRKNPLLVKNTDSSTAIIESYHSWFCARCKIFDCKLHGTSRALKQSRLNVDESRVIPLDGDVDPSTKALWKLACRLFPQNQSRAGKLFNAMTGDEDGTADGNDGDVEDSYEDEKEDDYENKRTLPSKDDLILHEVQRKMRKWRDPCNHSGPCSDPSSNCSCMLAKRHCEWDCCCDSDYCLNVAQGCQCEQDSTTCLSRRTCTCRRNGSECVVGKCSCCPSSSSNLPCPNCAIGVHANGPKLTVGVSTIHVGGLGTFACEDIAKDTFIGEYFGELISDTEANRRGVVYDEIVRVSFLFQLCQDHLVDAVRRGTKTKWINYAPDSSHSSSSESSFSMDSSSDIEFSSEELAEGSFKKKTKKKLKRSTSRGSSTGSDTKSERRVRIRERIDRPSSALSNYSKKDGTSRQRDRKQKKVRRITSNCRTSVTYVQGEPHICFFAKRKISKGEELSFDYGRFKPLLSKNKSGKLRV